MKIERRKISCAIVTVLPDEKWVVNEKSCYYRARDVSQARHKTFSLIIAASHRARWNRNLFKFIVRGWKFNFLFVAFHLQINRIRYIDSRCECCDVAYCSRLDGNCSILASINGNAENGPLPLYVGLVGMFRNNLVTKVENSAFCWFCKS